MAITNWLLALLIGQVPPPLTAGDGAAPLKAERAALLRKEADRLVELAQKLAQDGKAEGAAAARSLLEKPGEGGPIRFVPLPELVPSRRANGLANVPAAGAKGQAVEPAEARAIRAETSNGLFELAKRAAGLREPRFALADECLRGVIARQPDHAEARRLLGYVPHEGGWATPHAVQMLKANKVLDPTFGWVDANWVPHLAKGELPGRGQPTVWLPAEEANAQRREWSSAWQIRTVPHFTIQTNVPLAEAIAFARRLEWVHDLFFSLFADVIGPANLPLAQRFASPSKPVPAEKLHPVWYFASKEEYVGFFHDRNMDQSVSLGYYMPPKEARRFRIPARSYFYKDEQGAIDAQATLFHEASHQLLFESAGESRFDQNLGNYWLWEGLGTYFETLTPLSDGSLEIGGPVGPRFAHAVDLIVSKGQYVPIGSLVNYGEIRFKDEKDVYLHYAESMALVVFLMNGEGGRYRDGFLDYVGEAYRGKLRARGSGRSLDEHLGVPYKTLDEQFRAFLNAAKPAG